MYFKSPSMYIAYSLCLVSKEVYKPRLEWKEETEWNTLRFQWEKPSNKADKEDCTSALLFSKVSLMIGRC